MIEGVRGAACSTKVNGTQKQEGTGASGIKPGGTLADILAYLPRPDELVEVIPLMKLRR
jgi:hypothetical protein